MNKPFENTLSGLILIVLLAACGAPAASPPQPVAATATSLQAATPLPEVHGRLQLVEFFAIT